MYCGILRIIFSLIQIIINNNALSIIINNSTVFKLKLALAGFIYTNLY